MLEKPNSNVVGINSNPKNPENFPPPADRIRIPPLIRKREAIRGGILIWGVFLTGIALIEYKHL